VLVDGRPWKRISDIRRVQLVIQGGCIVADHRGSKPAAASR
jgi:hypothetical protein